MSPHDHEFQFAGMLGGLIGCWHRLWGSEVLQALGLLHLPTGTPDPILLELEDLLGRPLVESERAALREHAKAHVVYVSSPEAQEHLGASSDLGPPDAWLPNAAPLPGPLAGVSTRLRSDASANARDGAICPLAAMKPCEKCTNSGTD